MGENVIKAALEEGKFFPYKSLFYLHRQSFYAAGQDSFTMPPAQNADLFESLNNIEPVFQGILKVRRGYKLLSLAAPSVPYREGYSFRSESLNLKSLVFTSTATVQAYSESGTAFVSPIFTPTSTTAPRMVLSRNYGYFADGAPADSKKWDGTTVTGNLTNWGIDIKGGTSSTTGPNGPASGTASGGGTAWVGPGNITANDGVFAVAALPGSGASQDLNAIFASFGIAPATAVITGIKVDIKGKQTDTSATSNGYVSLFKAVGTTIGTAKSFQFSATNNFITLGGSNDTWGVALTGADLNTGTFGCVQTFGTTLGPACTFSVDYVQITVYVSGSSMVLGAPAGTGITLLSGRVYTVAFQNSKSGHTSGLYPFTGSTGPLANQGQPLSGIPVSSDSQVDQKLLLATADGGDQTTLFLVAQIPNANTTYTDIMPDSQLLTQPVYQETQADGTLHGVANNNLPPLINFPTKHKGRIYGCIQSTLYFSKNLADVTTSTGTITSKWEEAWPAVNQLDVSESAETIQGLLSDGETLYIATERCIRRLIGDSPSNFQKPEIQFNETGLINQDTWRIVYAEGQPVGAMWLTPDFRVMVSDFNSYQDVGTPIQDVLNKLSNNSLGPAAAHASFVSKGPAEYYMLYIATGGGSVPDTACVFDLKMKTWFVWTPTDTISTSLFFLDASGTPRWTFATNAGPLYEWSDTGTGADRVGNSPILYSSSAKTSWLDFGDFTLRKCLNQIILGTGNTNLMLTVYGANTDSDLDAPFPTAIVTNVLETTDPLKDLFVPLAGAVTKYRWYKFLFTLPANIMNTADMLDFYSVEAIPYHRY